MQGSHRGCLRHVAIAEQTGVSYQIKAMIHHVSLGTNNLDRAQLFYDAVLHEIGLRRLKKSDRIIAYGLTETLFSLELPVDGRPARPGNGTHVAFHAGHRKSVHAFYEAGLANGGVDQG